MKIQITENESLEQKKKRIDLYKTLKEIPGTIQTKLQFIQKEINSIVDILNHYDSIKEKLSNQHLDIQNYINEFLNSIKIDAEFLCLENKNTQKQVSKIKLPEVQQPILNTAENLNDNKVKVVKDKEIVKKFIEEDNEEESIEMGVGITYTPGKKINLRSLEEGLPLTPSDQEEIRRFNNKR